MKIRIVRDCGDHEVYIAELSFFFFSGEEKVTPIRVPGDQCDDVRKAYVRLRIGV